MSILHTVERGIGRLVRRFADRRWMKSSRSTERRERIQVHGDERTIRRAAEAQDGGVSSEESRAAYERGDNPGGLHRGGKSPNMPHRGGQDDDA